MQRHGRCDECAAAATAGRALPVRLRRVRPVQCGVPICQQHRILRNCNGDMLHQLVPYNPPWWARRRGFHRLPTHRVRLAQLPTPIHPWAPPAPPVGTATGNGGRDQGIQGGGGDSGSAKAGGTGLRGIRCFVKRDDMTGSDISGNKARKLEFLFADCLLAHDSEAAGSSSTAASAPSPEQRPHDSVVTVGGVQSNHARATAVVARQLGLEPHLLLRGDPASPAFDEQRPESLQGNLLFDRLVGAHVHAVSVEDYTRAEGGYVIPMGGSNAVGLWGYLEMVRELTAQQGRLGLSFDHVVLACGSGGSASGLAIGLRLLQTARAAHSAVDSEPRATGAETTVPAVPRVHGVCVCDSPAWFFNHVRAVLDAAGLGGAGLGDPTEWLSLYDGKGKGYAQSTAEELRYLRSVGGATGVVLDPVYTLKALKFFAENAKGAMGIRAGESVLFLHSGGVYGTYAQSAGIATAPAAAATAGRPLLASL